MKTLKDFLPDISLSTLTDGECLDIIYDIENQDHLDDLAKFKFIKEFLHLLTAEKN